MDTLTLSQARILAFLTCKKRFQLRYQERLAWPDPPLTPNQHTAVQRGQDFHQLLERFFLGFPIIESDIHDPQLHAWWQQFAGNLLPMPAGRAMPELRLTVPVGRHFLTGRFDLVIIGEEKEQPSAHIYDWKTSRPRPARELQDEWQSKLYLAMLAESKHALFANNMPLAPEHIKLSYWYVTDPQTVRTISYNQEQHVQNWAEIQMLVAEIDSCRNDNQWPLTDNWSHCRSCAYWAYCGRFEAGTAKRIIAEEPPLYDLEPVPFLEPDSP